MKHKSGLSLAFHTLSHMAEDPERVMTSAQIAAHADTNPVFVRRTLGKLRNCGLLRSEKGHAGGWHLAKAPKDITLADVYLALEETLISSRAGAAPCSCSVQYLVHKRVSTVLDDLEVSFVKQLTGTTIAQISDASNQANTQD